MLRYSIHPMTLGGIACSRPSRLHPALIVTTFAPKSRSPPAVNNAVAIRCYSQCRADTRPLAIAEYCSAAATGDGDLAPLHLAGTLLQNIGTTATLYLHARYFGNGGCQQRLDYRRLLRLPHAVNFSVQERYNGAMSDSAMALQSEHMLRMGFLSSLRHISPVSGLTRQQGIL
jgi:hypothetical protein